VDKNKVARVLASKKKKKKTSPWIYVISIGVGIVACLSRSAYNAWRGHTALEKFLTSFVCDDDDDDDYTPEGGFCHASLVPHGRTQQTTKSIMVGEQILVVPRHLQIWDLDALRDPFVQQELFQARHNHTNNPLDSGAYLAAYLARRYYFLSPNDDDPMRPYFGILPTYETLETTHPALWSEKRLSALLEPHSSSYAVAKGYHDMVRSEYSAFTFVSPTFRSQITEKQYQTMRVNVLSRSFGPGPPSSEEALQNQTMDEELLDYTLRVGAVVLNKSCHAMVPILDMYDHHPWPNVNWKYDGHRRAFVITASMPIQPGQTIVDSYGTYTDPHLFAKFGFVNGDGSGHTQASIAALHQPLDVDMKQQFSYISFSRRTNETIRQHQKEQMTRYLHFDDGYTECIQKENNPDAYLLKRIKLAHLARIANIPARWIVRVDPRVPRSFPSSSSTDIPITHNVPKFDLNELNLDASKAISTCRLISLTNSDFDGNATAVLKEALQNQHPVEIGVQNEFLEFRALACLARLSGLARWKFKEDENELMEYIKRFTKTSTSQAHHSRKWTAAHLRLGEMQTLDVVQKLAMSGMREMKKRIHERLETGDSEHVLPKIRNKPCPAEYSKSLYA
jgi:hypothetical protein